MHAKAVKIRAKIKDQQKGKQSNKQSLVRPDKAFPSGVAILSRGRATTPSGDGKGFCHASWWGVVC